MEHYAGIHIGIRQSPCDKHIYKARQITNKRIHLTFTTDF